MHSIDIKVRGYHLDLYGHVNNARYLEFLEEARWAYFDHHGGLEAFLASSLAFVIVNININYRRPALMNETMRISTQIASVGGRSAVIQQRVTLGESDTMIADANVTFVMFDSKIDKVVPIEGALRVRLEGLCASA